MSEARGSKKPRRIGSLRGFLFIDQVGLGYFSSNVTVTWTV